MTPPPRTEDNIDAIIRRESTRLTAALVAHLGTHQLALAEDVAQDAMLTALQNWQHRDVPRQPGAWLRRVAMNRAIDVLRRHQRETGFEEEDTATPPAREPAFDGIEDGELRLLYLGCHPVLPARDQVILCLQLAAGFTAKDIATLLLQPAGTVAQRLVRLKARLRDSTDIASLPTETLAERISPVLKVLYLMFCAGYLPARGDAVVRRDLVEEALRLAGLMFDKWPQHPEIAALNALFNLQASRLEARDAGGRLVTLANQDRQAWNEGLIRKAIRYLDQSQQSDVVTRYHLEAAIALEHATAKSFAETNWANIETLYGQLETMTGSPAVSVSRALAMHYNGNTSAALALLELLENDSGMTGYPPYHAAMAELARASGNTSRARKAADRARDLSQNASIRDHLDERFAGLDLLG